MTISDNFRETLGSASTYLASLLGYMFSQMADWPWMQIGAAILLTARLVQDLPRAYAVIKHWINKCRKTK